MKKYFLLLCIGLLTVSYHAAAKRVEQYEARLIIAMLDNLLKNSNLILPKTCSIQQNDATILSQLTIIESIVDGIAVSSNDAVIGELTDIGSCLDSQIDVPDDINNLNETIVSLLKTILLEIRGCNIP